MKKLYIAAIALGVASSGFAQKKSVTSVQPHGHARLTPIESVNEDATNANAVAPNLTVQSGAVDRPVVDLPGQLRSNTFWEQIIGYSTYDNQTNNSVQQRIIIDENDQVHATYTLSFEGTTTWTDRGTGYNQGEGYQWQDIAYDRLEPNTRTGWPGLVQTADGQAMIFSHSGTGGIKTLKRAVTSNDVWQTGEVPTALGRNLLWPRTVVDGSTIHLIALTEIPATTNTATPFMGIDGNLIYFRSTDNGATWDIQDHWFPEIDSLLHKRIDGDAYAIDARNGHVSIAVFNQFSNTFILTSSDNGSTWSSDVISEFEIPGYEVDSLSDVDLDGIADTIFCSDGTGSVLIDNDNISHVFFGSNFVLDDAPGDDQYSYFNAFELLYWNTNLETDSVFVVGDAIEDPDDNDEDFGATGDQIPTYLCALASMPTTGIDADGNIYLVYSAANDLYISDQVFRHLYATISSDGGETWSTPVDLTPDLELDGYEYVFPSMIRDVNDKLHIVAQRDTEPGLIVRGDLDQSEENDIIYLAITTDLDTEIGIQEEVVLSNVTIFPNPTAGKLQVTGIEGLQVAMSVYDQTGKLLVRSIEKALNGTAEMDLTGFPNGTYLVKVGQGEQAIVKEVVVIK
jgi:Secretion system C-terminal sorting domain